MISIRTIVIPAAGTPIERRAGFYFTAIGLRPEEFIWLDITTGDDDALLAEALSVYANKIHILHWWHCGKANVTPTMLDLIARCPNLAKLRVSIKCHSEMDCISSILEHPENRIRDVEVSISLMGNAPRFFSALECSSVTALTLSYTFDNTNDDFDHPFFAFLQKDTLQSLHVAGPTRKALCSIVAALTKSVHLDNLCIERCSVDRRVPFAAVSKFIKTLDFAFCNFCKGFDWSFLEGSSVREMKFRRTFFVNGGMLGRMLKRHIQASAMEALCFFGCNFTEATLEAMGDQLSRVTGLVIGDADDGAIIHVANALKTTGNKIQVLRLLYDGKTINCIKAHLLPALRHPNCNALDMSFLTNMEYDDQATEVAFTFHRRHLLFAFLQGRLPGKCHGALRRLPAELYRMVGGMIF